MKYSEYQNNEKSFRSLTGLSGEEFGELLPCFAEAHDDYFTHYDMKGRYRNNRRSFTIYGNSPLPAVEDRLFFIPVYLKNNPLQEYHAACFEMEQRQCNNFIHVLYHILEQCLREAGVTPGDSQKKLTNILKSLSEDGKALPVLLRDGTEREIPRPVDSDRQRENYGGKKKKHTLKNAVIITACRPILFVSPTVCGKMHDKKIADMTYSFPYPCVLYRDTGYRGYKPDGVRIERPVKKPKGRELAAEEKEGNRKIASFGIRMEHAMGSAKRMRIVKDECRLRADNFVGRIFKTRAAIHNFRIRINPGHYKIQFT
jgi:hypothetical protein